MAQLSRKLPEVGRQLRHVPTISIATSRGADRGASIVRRQTRKATVLVAFPNNLGLGLHQARRNEASPALLLLR